MTTTSEQLKLRATPSPYGDIIVNSVLSHSDVDYNFINLKGMSLSGISSSVSGSVSTLVFTKLNGGEYTVDITGVSASALASAMTEAVLYTNPNPTYVTIGGIEIYSTFSAVTMQDMWTDLLYPNLNPSFSNFDMSGVTETVDVGHTFLSGDQTCVWTTVNSGFIQPNSVKIYDQSSLTYLATGLANDGTEVVTIPYDITSTVRAAHTFNIWAQKMNNTWFGRNYDFNWYWRRFYGNSTDPNLDAAGITGLSTNQLSRLVTGNFVFSAETGYKYIVLPISSGWVNPDHLVNPNGYFTTNHVPQYIRDTATNLNIALAGASDGYTNTTTTGLPYKLISSIPNMYGYSDTYYVFRTKYQLGGAITIRID